MTIKFLYISQNVVSSQNNGAFFVNFILAWFCLNEVGCGEAILTLFSCYRSIGLLCRINDFRILNDSMLFLTPGEILTQKVLN